ncbi:MAG: DUF1460 domain-containing protein [Bacteroidales bacterium]|jgi:hypothetical protein|nr:DUF1460 domain-containing protein [Bacteroidales bacterium]
MKIILTNFVSMFLCLVTLAGGTLHTLPDTSKCRYSSQDVEIFNNIMPELLKIKNEPASELIIKAAMLRLGTPYVAGTLEKTPEKLTVDLHRTDCILFVESDLALALTAKSGNPSFENFCNVLRDLRYRNGRVKGYASRLHYTTEWINQAESRGILKDMDKTWKCAVWDKTFSFMSTHPSRYKQLSAGKGHAEQLRRIEMAESSLNKLKLYYIPKRMVPDYLDKLKSGDIIFLCSSIKGLDIAHVTICYKTDKKTTFIDASMRAEKVVIEPISLVEYINSRKSISGIKVARAIF